MRTLVIESATEACSAALFDDGTLIAGDYRVLGRGHAEQLVPMIAALPDKGRAGRIAVSRGPGSFTGVRVGLAAARALALAWNSELCGYATPALVAAMARDSFGARAIAVVNNGGHGEWFVQCFGSDGLKSGDAQSLPPSAALGAVGDVPLAGNRAAECGALRGYGEALDFLPDASAFDRLDPGLLSVEFSPIYGRSHDARLPQTR